MRNQQNTKEQQTNGGIMHNLQIKRTLPRDVIKWIQGLDLSYSLKDYRKDLVNGFLIGQIISRYEPGKIPMHAFQNTSNKNRRDNNWNLLTNFFNKEEVRKVKIEESEYNKIKLCNDYKSEQLYEFICRLYTVCTKRNLPESNNQQMSISPSKNPNLTASYLLKDDGLEVLENSRNLSDSNKSEIKSDKIQKQKNSNLLPKVDGKSGKVEGSKKGVSKRKSIEQKSDTCYQQENPYIQKYVFDYLNEILQECINEQQEMQIGLKQMLKRNELKVTEILMKNIAVGSKLLLKFFNGVKQLMNEIIVVMVKDINEIWKFYNYFVRMVSYLNCQSEEFNRLIELLVIYSRNVNLSEKKKMNKIFSESIIYVIVDQIKICTDWKKKEIIMALIYEFSGREIDDKKSVLFHLKDLLGSSNPLFFSWLAVLVREETEHKDNTKLIEDYIYYAHQNYSSSNYQLRIPSAKILCEVARNGWVGNIQKFFVQEINIRRSRAVCDIEMVYLISMYIIEGNEYQALVKGKNQGSTSNVKVYNPDNEKLSAEIKYKVQNISMTLAHLYHNCESQIVKEAIAKQTIGFIGDNAALMLVLVFHLSFRGDVEEFCKVEKVLYELKSTRVVIEPIKADILKQNVNSIMAEIVQLHSGKRSPNIPQSIEQSIPVYQQLPLLDFCISHMDIKKINIELWEGVSDRLCKAIIGYLEDERYQNEAWQILKKIYVVIFNYEMRMVNLNTWLCECLQKMLREKGGEYEMVKRIKQFFVKQYKGSNLQEIKICIEEINQLLGGSSGGKFIQI